MKGQVMTPPTRRTNNFTVNDLYPNLCTGVPSRVEKVPGNTHGEGLCRPTATRVMFEASWRGMV
jgi:hypothetical protein